ncbi:hypothetical protein ACLOJK_014720 [Asimina triloba]
MAARWALEIGPSAAAENQNPVERPQQQTTIENPFFPLTDSDDGKGSSSNRWDTARITIDRTARRVGSSSCPSSSSTGVNSLRPRFLTGRSDGQQIRGRIFRAASSIQFPFSSRASPTPAGDPITNRAGFFIDSSRASIRLKRHVLFVYNSNPVFSKAWSISMVSRQRLFFPNRLAKLTATIQQRAEHLASAPTCSYVLYNTIDHRFSDPAVHVRPRSSIVQKSKKTRTPNPYSVFQSNPAPNHPADAISTVHGSPNLQQES